MKNYMKAIVGILFLTIVTALLPVTSEAAVGAPAEVRQTGASTSGVSISWSKAPNAEWYYIQWSSDGVTWADTGEKSTNPSRSWTGFSSGATYYIRVGSCEKKKDSTIADVPDDAWSAPLEVVTAPERNDISNISVDTALVTPNSITYTWSPCPGATYYNMYDAHTNEFIGSTTVPSFTWGGLSSSKSYRIGIQPVRVSSSGFEASGSIHKNPPSHYTRPEKPATPTTGAFGLNNPSYSLNQTYFSVNTVDGAPYYEVEVYTVKGNKKVFTTDYSLGSMKVKRNTAYKYRCRYFTTYSGERIYGEWSDYRYFWMHSVTGQKKSNRLNLSWGKISNAQNYTVYISTRSTGGYKKVKTVGAKTTKLTIRKCGKNKIKKNKKYYIRVIAKVKDGKNIVSSDISWQGETR